MTQQQVTFDDSVRVQEGVIYEKVENELVLLHLESSLYFGLNPVGSRMWELLVESGDPRLVLDRIQNEYDVSADVASRDLKNLLNELAEKNLVSVKCS